MREEKWFSAKLRFVVMVEPEGGDQLNDCVYVFRAMDFRSAFDRAINIGEAAQKEYRNIHEKRVIWRFMEVIALDTIQSKDLDGAEVHSQWIDLSGERIVPFGTKFDPRTSKPTQTI